MNRLADVALKALPFVLILAAIALASLWNLDQVRLWVLTELGERDLQRVEAALGDPSDAVAARACTYVMQDGEGAPPAHLMEVLAKRPKVAFLCLEQVAAVEGDADQKAPPAKQAKGGSEPDEADPDEADPDEADPDEADPDEADPDEADPDEAVQGEVEQDESDQESADASEVSPPEGEPAFNPFATSDAELVPRHELVASKLGKYWMANLIDGRANSCQTAQDARRALEHAGLDPTYRLTSCAIAADSKEVRQCCVEELGGPKAFAKLMGRPDQVPLHQAVDDYSALVGASFPSVPLASSKAESDGSDASKGGVGERFGKDQSIVQDWVVDVGCRLRFSDASNRQTVEAFVALIESDGCASSDPPWQGYYSERSWAAMCTGMYTYRRAELDMTPREAICDSLERASLAQASTATQLAVAAAVGVASQVQGVSSRGFDVIDPGQQSSSGRSIFGRTREGMTRSMSNSRNTKILNSFIGRVVGP